MGERKGTNKYYPPDFNYKTHKSLNSYHGTHALRERARKLKDGILIIRFEMPFNIWCLGCNNHVGMGVRYNAEKKKIGMYYTTPLYEFKMKCHLCDNHYIIRTDPKNFDYELVEGLRRQEKRFDPADIDNLGAVDRGLAQRLASDAMLKAEHQKEDKTNAASSDAQIEKLTQIQSRMKYGYELNCNLRKTFRAEKKTLNEERAADSNLAKRLSTDIKLQPSKVEDTALAKRMLRLKDVQFDSERQEQAKERIKRESIFPKNNRTDSDTKMGQLKLKAQKTLPKRTSDIDVNSLIVKKSRPNSDSFFDKPSTSSASIGALVDYGSDSSSNSS